MSRPTIDEYYLTMSKLAATRGTCVRRQVGCVLVDSSGRVVSIGYNGVPPGMTHCIDHPCPGAKYPSGQGLEFCEATHAEQSALLACSDLSRVHACYTTVSPCFGCVKLLLQTGCKRAVFSSDYGDDRSRDYWIAAGRSWELIPS